MVIKHIGSYRDKNTMLLMTKYEYNYSQTDPTGKTQRDLNAKLLRLTKPNKISEFTYLFIYIFIMLCQFHTIISTQIYTRI
jgi:hypothetical protein